MPDEPNNTPEEPIEPETTDEKLTQEEMDAKTLSDYSILKK